MYYYHNLEDIDIKHTKILNDPNKESGERETHIYISGNEEYAQIDAEHPAIIKYLLKHPEFKLDKDGIVTTLDKDGNEIIVAIKGKIPRNCVRFSLKPRARFDKL